MNDLTPLSSDDLACVTGGARRGSPSPFGFLDAPYKNIVFHVASDIGGATLAEKMYGSHVTARDKARAQAAMKQFLVAGNKLPKGVPNLFG